MKSKKGATTDPIQLILGILLLLAIFGFSGCWLTEKFGSVIGTSDAISTGQLIQSCETLEKKYVSGPVKAVCYNCDYDEDGLKDFCDNCPLIDNYMNPQKLDLDKDLFVQGCCGNDGNLVWIKDDDPKNKWGRILDPKSLPCSHPQAKDGPKEGRGVSMTETTDTDDPGRSKNAKSKHPVYDVDSLVNSIYPTGYLE